MSQNGCVVPPYRHVAFARSPDGATEKSGQSLARLTDTRPYMPSYPAPASFPRAATRRHKAVSWHSTLATGCNVRMADTIAKSQLGMAASLALDTYLRTGHASDQAQVTVLRTLVRYAGFPLAGEASRRRVEVL